MLRRHNWFLLNNRWKREGKQFKTCVISHHNKVAKLLLSSFLSLFHHLTFILSYAFKNRKVLKNSTTDSKSLDCYVQQLSFFSCYINYATTLNITEYFVAIILREFKYFLPTGWITLKPIHAPFDSCCFLQAFSLNLVTLLWLTKSIFSHALSRKTVEVKGLRVTRRKNARKHCSEKIKQFL